MPFEPSTLRERGERLLVRARSWTGAVAGRSPRTQRYLLLLAAVAFVAMTVLALRALPPLDIADRWPLLVLVLVVGVPLSMLANAVEYVVSARIVGAVVRLGDAIRVTVLAMAANVLPLPGSLMVRTTALHGLGSGMRRAVTSTTIVALAWLGATGLMAGGLGLVARRGLLGTLGLGAGLVLTAAALLMLRRDVGPERFGLLTLALLTTEILTVGLGALRFWLVLVALGFPADLAQAAALVVAGVAAAATGIFPGGLGLRELLAGIISPVVGLPAALGLLATAVNRLLEYLVLLPVAIVTALRRRKVGEPVEVPVAPEPPG